MRQKFNNIEISVVANCVPKNVVDNGDFSELISGKDLRIFEKTVGILRRRYVEKNVTASDLALKAAETIFENTKIEKNEIQAVVFLSQTSDYKIPFTSNIIQHRLGLSKDTLCLDINGGCAGFVQGLGTAFSILNGMESGKVLFIVAETLSKILSPSDRSTTMLFGDGASACIISKSSSASSTVFDYHSDGGNFDAIIIPDGGYRNPVNVHSHEIDEDEKGNRKSRLDLSMDGARVFDFTLREIAPSIKGLLEFTNTNSSDVDYFLLHQSNKFIITQIASQMGIPLDRFLINIEDFGNTSGVSIPLLFTSFSNDLKNKKIFLCGYGSGLNWASCLIETRNITILPLIEY